MRSIKTTHIKLTRKKQTKTKKSMEEPKERQNHCKKEPNVTLYIRKEVKQKRAQGGCLGTGSRRRT